MKIIFKFENKHVILFKFLKKVHFLIYTSWSKILKKNETHAQSDHVVVLKSIFL